MPKSFPISDRFLAWALVPVLFLLGGVGRGLIESFTVFILPLQAAFNADRAEVAGVYSLGMLASGLGSPLIGRLFDRLGPLRLYAGGTLLLAAMLVLASFADRLWQFHLLIGLGVGIGGSAIGNVPHTALLARWFQRRLSAAVAVVYSSIGAGMLLVVPLAQWLIDAYGWRTAYQCLGAGAAIVTPWLLLLPWKRIAAGNAAIAARRAQAVAAGEQVVWTVGAAARTVPFWGLFVVFFLTSGGIYSVAVQAVAYLIESGVAPMAAASTWGMVGVLSPVGMVGFGWLDGVIGRRPSVFLTYFLSIVAYVLLWFAGRDHGAALMIGFAVSLGLTFGSRGPLVSSIAARLFPGPNLGAIYGTITLGGGIGAAFGSFVGGALHDWSGGYGAVFIYGIVSLVIAASPFWLIKKLARA